MLKFKNVILNKFCLFNKVTIGSFSSKYRSELNEYRSNFRRQNTGGNKSKHRDYDIYDRNHRNYDKDDYKNSSNYGKNQYSNTKRNYNQYKYQDRDEYSNIDTNRSSFNNYRRDEVNSHNSHNSFSYNSNQSQYTPTNSYSNPNDELLPSKDLYTDIRSKGIFERDVNDKYSQ